MVYKRKLKSGKTDWCYSFGLPGSTKGKRLREQKTGFTSKKEARNAEVARIVEFQKEADAAPAAPATRTLRILLNEFFDDFAGAPKTLERYRELADYLHTDVVGTPIDEVTALQLHKEWKRLLASGGHTRKDKTARPLSPKTVRNICGVVSSAFSYAILYELVPNNPAKSSKPPHVLKREKVALSPAQTSLLVDSATIHWMPAFLELDAATGCRRGELLALDWTDLDGNALSVSKSLTQTKAGLALKLTKNGEPRTIILDDQTLTVLAQHRREQEAYRAHFGAEYQGNLIFANPDGTPLKPDSVSSAVSLLFRRLKVPKPKGAALHLFRHTHGSQLIAKGVPITDVSKRLGHASPQTTLTVYAHALPNRDEDVAKTWREFQATNTAKETRQ